MHIVVLLKQVVDPEIPARAFQVSRAKKAPEIQRPAYVMSIFDGNALEVALKLREAKGSGVTVTAVTLGDKGAEDILRKALALTADNAVLLSDPAFTALDSLGKPGGTHNHYSLKAVQTHESRHATRILKPWRTPELASRAMLRPPPYRSRRYPTREPRRRRSRRRRRSWPSPTTAPATNAYNAWFHDLLRLVQNDHDTHGPCQDAEESITEPLKAAIEERAVRQRWVAAKPQITLPSAPSRKPLSFAGPRPGLACHR